MKAQIKLICLLLCLPFLFLACEKDNDKKQDELPPATHEFRFIETALSDYYTQDKIPLTIDLNNDQLYIGDIDQEISIIENDYTPLGIVENDANKTISANSIRFKRENGFFTYNQNFNYVMCFNGDHHRENEINDLPDLDNQYIAAIDVDVFDNLFLIYNHNTIRKYSSDLSGPISTITNIGNLFNHGIYDFKIMSICVDNDQDVYIAIDVYDEGGEGLDAVLKFDNDLNFLRTLSGIWLFDGPCGIAFDKENYMYVVSRYQSVVKVFNREFKLVTMSGEMDVSGSDNGLLDEPIGIRISNNRVYITEKGNHRISVFTSYN